MPHSSKLFYGLLTVAVLVALGLGASAADGEGLAFAAMASCTIGGALVCIWERSVVRSAFALMATFLGTAGLFLLLRADFLAMAQVLVYVGGILVLLLFGVMLTPPDLSERKLPRVLGGVAAIGAAFGWVAFKVAATVRWARPEAPLVDREVGAAREIGVGFLAADQYVVAFELAAVVLTVALVAAVYIARRRRSDLERPQGAA